MKNIIVQTVDNLFIINLSSSNEFGRASVN